MFVYLSYNEDNIIRGDIMATPHIEKKLKLLPDLPGCYLMKNEQGKIIYVGKAKKSQKSCSFIL